MMQTDKQKEALVVCYHLFQHLLATTEAKKLEVIPHIKKKQNNIYYSWFTSKSLSRSLKCHQVTSKV